jgi:hypothetical protein
MNYRPIPSDDQGYAKLRAAISGLYDLSGHSNADGYNFKQLKAEILKLSNAEDWPAARREWRLSAVYDAQQHRTCLCGHHPIREICVIVNNVNGNRTEVGNVCVKKFLGLSSDRVFQGLRRIRKDQSKSLNEDALVFFRHLFSPPEYEFLQDTMRKRVLTHRQLNWRKALNNRVLRAAQQPGPQVPSDGTPLAALQLPLRQALNGNQKLENSPEVEPDRDCEPAYEREYEPLCDPEDDPEYDQEYEPDCDPDPEYDQEYEPDPDNERELLLTR